MKIQLCRRHNQGGLVVVLFVVACVAVIITAGGCVVKRLQQSPLRERNRQLTNELDALTQSFSSQAMADYVAATGDQNARMLTLVSVRPVVEGEPVTYAVQSSTNLRDWEDVVLATNLASAEVLVTELLQAEMRQTPAMFYRIVGW